ncbi:MAG: hypothetical protein RLZZ488_1417 [Pseudomonadota bacterium]|jgi:organic radical activating enzyme
MNPQNTYLVNEVYPCLQGEGTNLGKPSVLVRLQICNLRCSWCDTPYTHTYQSDPVEAEGGVKTQGFKRLSHHELSEKIRTHNKISHIIISGGEPTLQNLAPLIEEFLPTHSLEVESNGTQIPHKNHRDFSVSHYHGVQWNISPKGRNASQNINPEALSHWSGLAQMNQRIFFKFVIRQEHQQDDLCELKELVNEFSIPDKNIILMPEGTSRESQLESTWLERICLENGWMMSTRLHVLLHGPRRGV